MTSRMTKDFRKAFKKLPLSVQRQAKQAFAQWKDDPYHSSLRFKRVHQRPPVYSVRINIDYRALAVRDGDKVAWFWIGPHAEYDRIVATL